MPYRKDYRLGEPGIFEPLRDALQTRGDFYMHLADLRSYLAADERLCDLYRAPSEWAERRNTRMAAAEREVRGVIDSYAETIRAKDAAGFVEHQTQDMAPPLGPFGVDPEGAEAWFATWRGQIGYEIGPAGRHRR
jgi:Carbohydrate phosphorylase